MYSYTPHPPHNEKNSNSMMIHSFSLLFPFLLLQHSSIVANADFEYTTGRKTVVANNPIANPAAVVIFGHARFTILYDDLVRLEYSTNVSFFDDRASQAIVNRYLPTVPLFNVTHQNSTSIRITTNSLEIRYIDNGSVPPRTCDPSSILNNTDQSGGVRVPDYPNGTTASTVSACCNLCSQDTSCTAFVYEPSSSMCWLMENVQSTIPNSSDRQFGGITGGSGFNPNNLQIAITNDLVPPSFVWIPTVSKQTKNLNGTYSSLDCYSTPGECYDQYWGKLENGLLSLDGWNLYDDTQTFRFVNPSSSSSPLNWTWWDMPFTSTILADYYFSAAPGSGSGSSVEEDPTLIFRKAISEFASLTGGLALPPRWALTGPWWSRYYPYSNTTLIEEVLQGYANYSIPLSGLVLDMDWHNEPTDKTCGSWGNYDVNTNLWPDMEGFIASMDSTANVLGHPVQMSLNIHPQTGVDHCDHRYLEFAQKLQWDTSNNATIPCNLANISFAETLFDTYLNQPPLENIAVWWTDYGGCDGLNPLFISNYAFATYRQLAQGKRPMAFSRYGGLGEGRYPIGFSGDTFQHELTLDWLIQTTPLAANILFGYWSHDVGGFHNGQGAPGDADPTNYTGSELFTRFVQAGALFPIMRTHCDHCERRIFVFQYHFQQLRDAFFLRHAMGPYIYTEAHGGAYESGIALVHPVYYDTGAAFPEAFTYTHQYMFGDSILCAPISAMVDPITNTSNKTVWLPPGSWSRWDGEEVLSGPSTYTDAYTIDEIPLFVRAGSILAFKPLNVLEALDLSPSLLWTIWPGGTNGSYTVYEDDGDSPDYMKWVGDDTEGAAYTTASYEVSNSGSMYTVIISPTEGSYIGIPSTRAAMMVQIRGLVPSSYLPSPLPTFTVTVNGQSIPMIPPPQPPPSPPSLDDHSDVITTTTTTTTTTPVGWWINTEFSLTAPIGAVVVNGANNVPMNAVTTIVVEKQQQQQQQ